MTVGQHPNFDAALVALVALVRALVDALVALVAYTCRVTSAEVQWYWPCYLQVLPRLLMFSMYADLT